MPLSTTRELTQSCRLRLRGRTYRGLCEPGARTPLRKWCIRAEGDGNGAPWGRWGLSGLATARETRNLPRRVSRAGGPSSTGQAGFHLAVMRAARPPRRSFQRRPAPLCSPPLGVDTQAQPNANEEDDPQAPPDPPRRHREDRRREPSPMRTPPATSHGRILAHLSHDSA